MKLCQTLFSYKAFTVSQLASASDAMKHVNHYISIILLSTGSTQEDPSRITERLLSGRKE